MKFIDKFLEYAPCFLSLDNGFSPPALHYIDSSGTPHKLRKSEFDSLVFGSKGYRLAVPLLIDLTVCVAFVAPVTEEHDAFLCRCRGWC